MKTLFLLFGCFTTIAAFTQSVVVNPDGTHSVLIDHGGGTSIAIHPDGTHSVVVNHGAVDVVINPDGTHSVVVHANQATTSHLALAPSSINNERKAEEQLSMLLTASDDELRLKLLRQFRAISRKEYKEMKAIGELQQGWSACIAQLVALYQQKSEGKLSKSEYREQKTILISELL